jgi:hypothetical protein
MSGVTTYELSDADQGPGDGDHGRTSSSLAVRVGLVLGWIALLGRFFFDSLGIVRANHLALVHRMPDDSYYYLEIAARAGRGQGFTFDGTHETNGFHPLWQVLLVPVTVMRGDALVRAALLLALLCSLVAVLLVVRVVWKLVGPGPALAGGIVAVQMALPYWVNGMEGAATILMFALLLTALVAFAEHPARGRAAVVGIACAGVVFARLDAAVVVVLIPIAMLWRTRSWKYAGWCAGTAAGVLVPFAMWWIVRWHHVLTTSATVKSHAVDQFARQHFGGRFTTGYAQHVARVGRDYLSDLLNVRAFSGLASGTFGLLVALVLTVLSAIGWSVVLRTRTTASGPRPSLGPIAWALCVVLAALALKAAVDIVAAPLWARAWYSSPQRFAAGFLIGAGAWIGLGWIWRHTRPVAVVCVAIMALSLVPPNLTSWARGQDAQRNENGWQDQLDLAADWIRDHGPSGRYGARDAGLVGFQLDGVRDVVNLDGLVNNYDYANLVRRDTPLSQRVAAEHVDYFVGRISDEDRARELDCSTVLWTSPGEIPYDDDSTPYSIAPVRIFDVRACRASDR